MTAGNLDATDSSFCEATFPFYRRTLVGTLTDHLHQLAGTGGSYSCTSLVTTICLTGSAKHTRVSFICFLAYCFIYFKLLNSKLIVHPTLSLVCNFSCSLSLQPGYLSWFSVAIHLLSFILKPKISPYYHYISHKTQLPLFSVWLTLYSFLPHECRLFLSLFFI